MHRCASRIPTCHGSMSRAECRLAARGAAHRAVTHEGRSHPTADAQTVLSNPVPRRFRRLSDIWAGLLASGSTDSPRLPVSLTQWQSAAFVPGYSGGTATDSHRLPYSPAKHTSTGTPVVRGIIRAASEVSMEPEVVPASPSRWHVFGGLPRVETTAGRTCSPTVQGGSSCSKGKCPLIPRKCLHSRPYDVDPSGRITRRRIATGPWSP